MRVTRTPDLPVDPLARLRDVAGQDAGKGSSDFDLVPDLRPTARELRPAGVLVPFIETKRGLDLILTKRSSALKHHPGQIAFPGGKLDPTDRDVIDTALREAHEEIALPRDAVEVLGTLPTHETVSSFTMTPVLAHVTRAVDLVPEAGEVAEIFTVPFEHIADPANYLIEGRFFRGQRRQYYTVPWGPYYIWGATARILRSLAERLSQ